MNDEVKEQIAKEQQQYKSRFDEKYVTDFSFKVGQLVWLNLLSRSKGKSPKLQVKYTGPYVILKRVGPVDY
jgi:hypothetical protein